MGTKHRHIRKTSYAQKCNIISMSKQMKEHTNIGNSSELHTFLMSKLSFLRKVKIVLHFMFFPLLLLWIFRVICIVLSHESHSSFAKNLFQFYEMKGKEFVFVFFFFRKNQRTPLKHKPLSSHVFQINEYVQQGNTPLCYHFILLGFLSQKCSSSTSGSSQQLYPDPDGEHSHCLCCAVGSAPSHPHVHLLGNFSFLEICYVTTTVPICWPSCPQASPSPLWAVLHSSTSSSLSGVTRASTFASWPLTSILPSAVLCITHASWLKSSTLASSSLGGPVGSFSS